MKTDQKFLNELYTIKNIQKESVNKLTIQVELNRDHDIFKGHFPGNPVLPGVCTIQILKELLQIHLGKNLNLAKAGTIKYLSFIDPVKNSTINYEIQLNDMGSDRVSCSTTIKFESIVFCSLKSEFIIIPE
jgi:3-hydroxyacyl-[acyl-carrier-protein] dehydratase